MSKKESSRHRVKSVTKLALVSVSYVALVAVGASDVRAQASPPAEQGATQSDEPPSPPGTPAQEAPTAQPDASPSPVTPAQQQPNVPPLPQVTVEAPRQQKPAGRLGWPPRTSPPPPRAPRRSRARRSQARRTRARRYRRPGRRAAHKMRARGRWASMQQHAGGDQDQYAAHRHSAVA